MHTNSLLNYCIMPVVFAALVAVTRLRQIGISTALYAATMIFKNLKSHQIHNALAQALVGQKISNQLKKVIA
jgi:hypothetical protein